MKIIEFSALECMQLRGPIETNLENCVYILKRNGVIEYIGSTTRSASQRLREHSTRIKMDGVQVEIRKYEVGEISEKELRRIECELINQHKPKRNSRMKVRITCETCGKICGFTVKHTTKFQCIKCDRIEQREEERQMIIALKNSRKDTTP